MEQRYFENKAIRLFYLVMALSGVITSLTSTADNFMGGLERAVGFGQFFIYVGMHYMSKKNRIPQSIVVIYGAMILQAITMAVSIANNFSATTIDLNLIQSDIIGGLVIIWALYHRQKDLNRIFRDAKRIQERQAR